jgi:hypothetical protein
MRRKKIMRRFILGAVLALPFLASPLWARPDHGHRGRDYHGYGRSYGYGYRSWYVGPAYVAPTYVAPAYQVSPEYRTRYQIDADALVNAWYRRYLGRDMDPAGIGWVGQVRDGVDPASVLASILGSDEYFERSGGTPDRFVDRLYQDAAGRRPTGREREYAVRYSDNPGRVAIANDLLHQNPGAVMIQ